jgi:hypothetical protein
VTQPICLPVRCPICDALPNDPCEDIVNGWIVAKRIPHLHRFVVANQEAAQ